MSNIDFILTWVDGNDPLWQKEYQKYVGEKKINFAHYREYGTLRYWFRAVEKYAPWVRKIHFVTCGQIPAWMNTENQKLHLVSHSDYMPEQYLPTFSANPIELNLHRIKGLSEQFVYFNDDTFLAAPVSEDDFFLNGLPRDSLTLSALIPSVKDEVITYILFNDLLLINANFNKKSCMKNNLSKWFNMKYGRNIFKNLYYAPIGKFSGFVNPHLPNAFLKTTFEEVWAVEKEYLDKVSQHQFRTKEDVNQYLMRYWQLVTGKFIPRSNDIGVCYTIGVDDSAIEYTVKSKNRKLLCINDNPMLEDIEFSEKWLVNLLEKCFPEKSTFEKW